MEQINTGNSKGYQVRAGEIGHLGDNYYLPNPVAVSVIVDETLPPIRDWMERPQEETQVRDWLQDDRVRLIGIVGAGGFGKSALAAHLFNQMQGFRDKFWSNFQQSYHFNSFARRMLQHLKYEVDEKFTDDELITELLNRLTQGRYLLILDNLETLLQTNLWQPYQTFLERWLGVGGGGSIIVTSQEQLDLPSRSCRWLSLAGLSLEQGVELLKRQNVQGSEDNLKAFVELADGHPLLLNLATDWLLLNSQVEDSESQRKLETNDVTLFKTVVGQHRRDTEASVGKVFEESFRHLTPRLQTLLMNVSIYRPSFTLEAAQVMISADAEAIAKAELQSLERRSFLLRQKSSNTWQFQPLIKRYVQYVQREFDNLAEAHERAIKYYQTTAKFEVLPTDEKEVVSEHLEIFYHYYELQQYAEAFKALNGCYKFLSYRGYDKDQVQLYEQLIESWQPNNDETLEFSSALTNLGNIHLALGHSQQAIKYYRQRLKIARQSGDPHGEAVGLGNLGAAYRTLRHFERAIVLQQKTLEIVQSLHDDERTANALDNLGDNYKGLEQYQRAIEYYQQALKIRQRIHDKEGEVNSLGGLGTAYLRLNHYPQALQCHQQALSITRSFGNRAGEANSLTALGGIYFSLEQYQQSIKYYQQASEVSRRLENPRYEATLLDHLGNVYNALRQYEQAVECHQKSLELAKTSRDREIEASALLGLGIDYAGLKQYPLATESYEKSLEISRQIGAFRLEAAALNQLGNICFFSNQHQRAIDFYEQSAEVMRRIGDRLGEAHAQTNIGRTQAQLDQKWEAITAYEAACRLYQEMGLSQEVEKCESLIRTLNQVAPITLRRAPKIENEPNAPLRSRRSRFQIVLLNIWRSCQMLWQWLRH